MARCCGVRDEILSTGYRLIAVDRYTFAQLPPHFSEDVIPDEYIFNPEWSREPINEYWRSIGPCFSEKEA